MWKISLVVSIVALYWIWSRDSFDPVTLFDKRVLVTGASSGIGEHLAYEYSKLGARVMVVARRAALLEKVAQKCLELGARQAEVVVADMVNLNDRDKVLEAVEQRLGGLDVLLLNHAIATIGWWSGVNHTNIFRRDFEVNFMSFVDLTAKMFPMLTKSNGSVGVVSSVAGKAPIPGLTVYSSAKFALQGFFHSLRQEFSLRGIEVSVTLAVIGAIYTEIVAKTDTEKRMFSENFGWFFSYFMETPQNTAVAILKGVSTKQHEIYFGRSARVIAFLPGFSTYLSEIWPRSLSRGVMSLV